MLCCTVCHSAIKVSKLRLMKTIHSLWIELVPYFYFIFVDCPGHRSPTGHLEQLTGLLVAIESFNDLHTVDRHNQVLTTLKAKTVRSKFLQDICPLYILLL